MPHPPTPAFDNVALTDTPSPRAPQIAPQATSHADVNWKEVVAPYQKATLAQSLFQVANTTIPFFSLWYLMYLTVNINYLVTLGLSLPAGLLLVRLFCIQHDCGHGSFFNSRRANAIVGTCCSVFTLTPYLYWKKSHAIHHAHVGNLSHRGIGDVQVFTVKEYLALPWWGKLAYRVYRNPFVLFGVIATLLFVVIYRFPTSKTKTMKSVEYSVWWTDVAIGCLVTFMCWLVGWRTFLWVHAPTMIVASSVGTWLFYMQHQYEDTYWEHKDKWDFTTAALEGSSYYNLPKVLHWFTGNIGYHHIHHLSPRIPNYTLAKCHAENPELQNPVVITLASGFKSFWTSLWDEDQRKLISFTQLARQQRAGVTPRSL